MSFRVLSTKILNTSQQQLLLNANIAFVHTNFIETSPLDFPMQPPIENAIFTSKNALKAIEKKNIEIRNVFCVGSKTKEIALAAKLNVVVTANNARELSEIIIKEFGGKSFTFFCGERRLNILPKKLRENSIDVREVTVYTTKLTPKKYSSQYDGVLFFSPSAVESYMQMNLLENTIAFCIGKSTAAEAEKYTGKIITASIPTVENVLARVVKFARTEQTKNQI